MKRPSICTDNRLVTDLQIPAIYKSVLICYLYLLSSCTSTENSNYQVKGKLQNSSGGFITLVNVNVQPPQTLDSAQVNEDGEFVFLKKVPSRGYYSIQVSPSNFTTIITDSSEKVILDGNAQNLRDSVTISGSPDSELFLAYNAGTQKLNQEKERLRAQADSVRRVFEAYMNTTEDSIKVDSLSKKLEPVFNSFSSEYVKKDDAMKAYTLDFIGKNPSSFACLAAVASLNPEKEMSHFINVAEALAARYPDSEVIKGFKGYVDRAKKTAMGMPIQDITMNNVEGKPISLSSLKGKVVLVDFWASWCKPCRVENPFVVKLYQTYKSKGFDIFSVSLDQDGKAWLKAIQMDKLAWPNHVCDFKMWQSPVVGEFGFNSIPFTILIDQQGNIAGKNLRGPMLEEKIKELIGNP